MVCGDHESDWATVLSGVPQGSVLGPLLFLVFINDLPELVTNYCKLFADDTKLIGVVKNSLNQKILQEDIDKLVNWSKKWNMEFNEGKCKVMNIGGHKSIAPILSMENSSGERVVLHETMREKDLGVIVNSKLKWDDQVNQAALKATSVLGMLKRTFVHWSADLFLRLYPTYVRPHLEYCSTVWNPYKKKDIRRLEQVQRRATNFVPELRHLNYESRLANFQG